MIIKTYTGKTENEALEKAKKELGNGIVIMNSKTVKPKGFSLFKKKHFEITVACDSKDDIAEAISRVNSIQKAAQEKKDVAKSDSFSGLNNGLKPDQSSSSNQSRNDDNIEKKLDSLSELLKSNLKIEESEYLDNTKSDEEKKEVSKDTSDTKDSSDSHMIFENPEQEKFIKLLYNTMIDNEVDEKYANEVLDEIVKSTKENTPIDYILANVYQKLILKFGNAKGITPCEEGPRTAIFIGPTGVGKTTTIAKLASYLAVEEKKKVALLTTDTFRIAAAEQLRTYANILEVYFRIIYSVEELEKTVEELKDFDYIFVDTAGHSHQNKEQLDKTNSFLEALASIPGQESFLVLSATTKYRDLIKISDIYKKITSFQLVFTKLDETENIGNLLNLRLYTDSPIAYVTYGQNVPNDIERFNPQKTVKKILGGR